MMSKLMAKAAIAGLGLAGVLCLAAPSAGRAALGPQAAACHAGATAPALLVTVDGFKARSGNLRVALYRANDEFLARHRWLQRIDVPVTRSGPMSVCVPVPAAGRYAVAVRHDISGDGSDWGDGGGFSRNPRISLLSPRPNVRDVAISVGPGIQPVGVVLNYRFGLSIHPVAG
jgi:uncharacterized protein (DUF2141 family)